MNAPDKCWICLSSDETDWRKVCHCNLRVHEQCVLQWARTMGPQDPPRCPQCQTEIVIEQQRSSLVDLRDLATKICRSMLKGALLTTIVPMVLVNSSYQTLYELGSWSVKLMCGAELSSKVLGPLWTVHRRLAPFGMHLINPDPLRKVVLPVAQFQRSLGLPMIPVWLCARGATAQYSSAFLLAILGTLQGPEKGTLVALIMGRFIYRQIYNITAGMYLRKLSDKVLAETEADEVTNAMQQLDDFIDQARQQQNRGEEADDGQVVQVVEAMQNLTAIEAQRDGHWLIGKDSTTLRIANGVLAPIVGSLTGNLLRHVSWFSKMSTLDRNLMSLCALVLLRDAIALVVAYKRANSELNRRVLNYEEAKNSNNNGMLHKVIDLLDNRFLHLLEFDVRIN